MKVDSRWKQRFQNFKKAFIFFESVVKQESFSKLEVAGIVQACEFTFELAWKTIKDYLYEQGINTKFPREAIKEAFHYEIIADGQTWLHMLEKRNELSHTYNETVAENAVNIIKQRYYPALAQGYKYLNEKHII
jgi:nucleotidyltransferase substrate binding protein (TIGR01987 family)